MTPPRSAPKPMPPASDAAGRLAALESQLARTLRALYIERALRAHPEAEHALDLITATDEEGVLRQAQRLADQIARNSR